LLLNAKQKEAYPLRQRLKLLHGKHARHNENVAAAVVFYGGNRSPFDPVQNVQCLILCDYAGADAAITESVISLLKQILT